MYSKDLNIRVTPSRLSSQLVVGVVLINLFVSLIVGLILYQNHRQYEASAENMTHSLAHVLESRLTGILEQIDLAMLAVSDEATHQLASGKINGEQLNAFLTRQQQRLPQVDSLRVADEQGIVKYGLGVPLGSKVNISDRQYFIDARVRNNAKPVVSEPIFARINKKWVLPIARRINRPDGSFAGIVYAFISLEYISTEFSHLNIGAQGVVNLRDGELKNIVRYPESRGVGADIGKATMTPALQASLQVNKEVGTYRVRAVLDGIERTYSYRKLSGQPLYVTVGFSADDYLAEWRAFSTELTALLALFMLLSSVAAWLLYRGEQRRGEVVRALQTVNRDFLTLLESTTDFIYFKDKDSRIRFCSQTLADITGHQSWREMVGKHDFEIFPEDTARIYYEEELPVFRDGTPILNRIDPYYDEQGKQGWVSTNKWPVFADDGKTVLGIFGISRDISEFKRAEIALRESEARLRAILENEPECIKIVDEQGRLTQMNAAGLGMIEADSLEQVTGNPVLNVIAPEYRDAFDEMHRRVLAGESMQMKFEVLGLRGGRRMLETHAVPMQDHGKTVHLAVTRDITERQKTEEALKRSNADLERFAYSVSHDMRQPLRAVSGHLQLLQRTLKDKLNEDERENMGFALEGAKRMDSMIVSLLDYSRVGRKTEEMQWITSRNSLDEALGFLAPLIHDSKAQVVTSGEWPRIFASRDEMTRLFQNLIGNAIKFCEPQQPAQVEIGSSIQGKTWRVSVRDHGVGIDPQQIDRLFQFFSRLQSRTRFEGTGMGLALCRRIVEHQGGRIWVESEGAGKGSAFIFELPMLPEAERK
jgi:PAS domain S-box-containing protein